MSKRFLVLLPLALASLGSAREHTANWLEVRSPHFTVVTNSSEKQGRRITVQFERMRAIFREAYPQLEDDPDAPVVVLAIKSKDEFRALQPSAYASKKALPLHGMFVGGSDKNYILMRLDSEAGNPYPVVYHEYTICSCVKLTSECHCGSTKDWPSFTRAPRFTIRKCCWANRTRST